MDPSQRPHIHPTPHAASSSPTLPSPAVPDSANTSFAFLVHSQETIPNNLPPSVDNKPLARQRRRRTSPEDQAILEEEFLRDSKPDKVARGRIVERVALGEKEVQIWFQNRRQNSRRKSRPLLPHEILPLLQASRNSALSSSPIFSVAQYSATAPSQGVPARSPTAECPIHSDCSRSSPDSLTSPTSLPSSVTLPERHDLQDLVQESATVPGVTEHSSTVSSHGTTFSSPTLDVKPTFRRTSPGIGRVLAVADLISPEPDMISSKMEDHNESVEQPTQKNETPLAESVTSLKRTRSTVRLSMTSDGAARLLTGDESSPSPPRSEVLNTPTSFHPNGLRRSFSAAGLSDSSNAGRSMEPGHTLRRMPSGRSRDSRAWEFWCDTEARNELVKKADQEQAGSAVNAISMIRSNSRGPLTPNMNKGNVSLMRHSSAKRAKTESTSQIKPMLGRTKSSVARLQGETVRDIHLYGDKESDEGDKPTKANTSVISPSGESDKENWEPDAPSFGNGRRRLPPIRTIEDHLRRPILMESRSVPSQSSKLAPILQRNLDGIRERTAEKENCDPEKDDEIADFMRTARKPVAPAARRVAGDDDMDCIQGLLSLSQGAWR